jgi:hypothetical protein
MKLSDVAYDIYAVFPRAHFEEINGEVVIYTGMVEDEYTMTLHPIKEVNHER